MQVVAIRVRPRPVRGGYVLDRVTYFEPTVPGKPWVHLSKREVLLKGANGRGRIFPTHQAAREYHRDHLGIKEHG